MKRTFSIGLFLTTFLLFISCDKPLNEYKPKNEDEKQIIALLNTYLDARNKKDLKGLQATFSKDGIYYGGTGAIIKASEIATSDPEWWTMYGDLRLYDPKITINGNVAKLALVTLYRTFSTQDKGVLTNFLSCSWGGKYFISNPQCF